MPIDMEQFHGVFFDESFEGLDVMESGLLGLDQGTPDPEVVNAVFRAAHSIKGGSGTFGFSEICEFTHAVETLLDQLRCAARPVTARVVEALLASVDSLREMLEAARGGSQWDLDRTARVHARLSALLDEGSEVDEDTGAQTAGSAGEPVERRWDIRFAPFPHMLRSGNEPHRMFRELALLGALEVHARPGALPPLAELDPECAYLAWDLVLRGPASGEQIDEVFAWVDGDCELAVVEHDPPPAGAPEPLVPEPLAHEPAASDAPAAEAAPAPDNRRAGGDRRIDNRRSGSADTASIRVGTEKIDELVNLVGELVITHAMLARLDGSAGPADPGALKDGLAQLERNTRELQESVLQIRMLPISFCFNRLPRLVHDLGTRLGKQVVLEISGDQTELDKTVLEKIGDPLVHLVRNAVDHGLEAPPARRAAGKPETGRLHLSARHASGSIIIELADDGTGLPVERIRQKAEDRGLIGAQERLSDQQVVQLIFRPGLSTASEVSDISGRGVGMDVVQRNIRDLGGEIEVQSRPGEGCTFTIRLPLTLAILDGQLLRVGTDVYIVSLPSIVESLQLRPGARRTIAGRAELIDFRGEYIPIVRLHEVFGLSPQAHRLEEGLVVVVEADGHRVGLFIDALLGQQQVVIKSLETNFRHVPGLAGATILGDGAVALILDVPGLVRANLGDDCESPRPGPPAHAA